MTVITNRRLVKEAGADFYPTPAWATWALLSLETFSGTTWECACGDGQMSRELIAAGLDVESSDLHDYGYGRSGVDFLTAHPIYPANIITNPPFNSAEQFIERALMQAQSKVALLLRLAFLESAGRYQRLFSVQPPARVWVFTERITMYPGGDQTAYNMKSSGTTAYCWMVWDKAVTDGTTVLKWIPPGFRGAA